MNRLPPSLYNTSIESLKDRRLLKLHHRAMESTMRRLSLLVSLLVLFLVIAVTSAQSNNSKNPKKGAYDAASTHYWTLKPVAKTGQERVFCRARGRCFYKVLTCPTQCPQKKPKKNKKKKGCFIDCSSKCEVTCKCKFLY